MSASEEAACNMIFEPRARDCYSLITDRACLYEPPMNSYLTPLTSPLRKRLPCPSLLLCPSAIAHGLERVTLRELPDDFVDDSLAAAGVLSTPGMRVSGLHSSCGVAPEIDLFWTSSSRKKSRAEWLGIIIILHAL